MKNNIVAAIVATFLFCTSLFAQAFNGGTSFGDGSDGPVTISSGTTTLTRDMYYSDLTVSSTGVLLTAGYRIFVSGTLTVSCSSAPCIAPTTAANGVAGNGAAAGDRPGELPWLFREQRRGDDRSGAPVQCDADTSFILAGA